MHMHMHTPSAEAAATKTRRGLINPQPLEAATLPDALLKVQTVSAITGLSAATIYRKMAAGEFVEPVRLGTRCTRWNSGRIQAWIAAQQLALAT